MRVVLPGSDGGVGSVRIAFVNSRVSQRLQQHDQLLLCCQRMKIQLHALAVLLYICSGSMTINGRDTS